jgi:hypothetical protein
MIMKKISPLQSLSLVSLFALIPLNVFAASDPIIETAERVGTFLGQMGATLLGSPEGTNCSQSTNDAPAPKVPTAAELFLTGKFMLKPPKISLHNEDHYGHDLDLSERRPAVDLTGTVFDKKYGKPGTKLVANFFDHGKFYIARVPDEGVDNSYFIVSYFPPKIKKAYLAAHSLLRFEMKKDRPIELVAEVPDVAALKKIRQAGSQGINLLPDEPAEPRQIRNIALSAEAQWTKDDPKKAYNLFRGADGAFVQIIRFESMETRFKELYDNGLPSDEFLMKTKGDPSKALSFGLAKSQSDGISKMYNTLFYQCTTTAFDIVEKGEGIKDPQLFAVQRYADRMIPTLAHGRIKAEGGQKPVPLQADPSLAEESRDAYSSEIKDAQFCKNIQQAATYAGESPPKL